MLEILYDGMLLIPVESSKIVCDKSKCFDSSYLENLGYKYQYTKLPLVHWSKNKEQILDSKEILYQDMIDNWWYPVADCGYDVYVRNN